MGCWGFSPFIWRENLWFAWSFDHQPFRLSFVTQKSRAPTLFDKFIACFFLWKKQCWRWYPQTERHLLSFFPRWGCLKIMGCFHPISWTISTHPRPHHGISVTNNLYNSNAAALLLSRKFVWLVRAKNNLWEVPKGLRDSSRQTTIIPKPRWFPTHPKNLLVNLDHLPKKSGWTFKKKQMFETTTYIVYVCFWGGHFPDNHHIFFGDLMQGLLKQHPPTSLLLAEKSTNLSTLRTNHCFQVTHTHLSWW